MRQVGWRVFWKVTQPTEETEFQLNHCAMLPASDSPQVCFFPWRSRVCHCLKAPPQRAVEPSSGTWSEQAVGSPFLSQFCLPRILPLPFPLLLPLPSVLNQVGLTYIHTADLLGRLCPAIWPQVFWNQACAHQQVTSHLPLLQPCETNILDQVNTEIWFRCVPLW